MHRQSGLSPETWGFLIQHTAKWSCHQKCSWSTKTVGPKMQDCKFAKTYSVWGVQQDGIKSRQTLTWSRTRRHPRRRIRSYRGKGVWTMRERGSESRCDLLPGDPTWDVEDQSASNKYLSKIDTVGSLRRMVWAVVSTKQFLTSQSSRIDRSQVEAGFQPVTSCRQQTSPR